ncbi:membrane or secreted protein [Rhodopirellula sp. SWK7]|uniref:membrane or secreted protein n=1 Tax=Rhodopirellula sp. SWK7 TaxID=595460 RepID=UPI001F3BAB5A|nr:membrane or secreted protein [Rhodopirellula sp. SWK7]
MSQRQMRIQLLYLFLAIGCAAVLTAGCDAPVGDSEVDSLENVDTSYSDSMFDNGTSLEEYGLEDETPGKTWASPDGEPGSDVKPDQTPDAPVKPTFQSNAGTGSSDKNR